MTCFINVEGIQEKKKHRITNCARDFDGLIPPTAKKFKEDEKHQGKEGKQQFIEPQDESFNDRLNLHCIRGANNTDYKSLIFPPYKHYMDEKANDPTMRYYLLEPPPTTVQKKRLIVQALCAARKSLLEEHVKAGNIHFVVDSRLDILDTCLILAHDYNLLGYKKFKKDWDTGTYYREGTLNRSLNVGIDDFVGEVTEFVCPNKELERIIDPFTKAIAIVETWMTEDDFITAWNDFFEGKSDSSDARFVYLGWKFEKYLGWNGRFVKNQNNVKQLFCQFSSYRLAQFWNRARNTVKALLVMDCIDFWAYRQFRSSGLIDEPFDFSFDSCDD